MAENNFTPETQPQAEPELRLTKDQPKGVLQKNLKTFVYLGAALLVIVAAFFSSSGKKTPSQQAAKGQPPQPMLQDNTDNNVLDLKNQLQAERQKEQQQAALAAADPTLAGATPAQQAAAAAYSPTGVAAPCVPGQLCPQAQPGYGQPGGQPQLSPEQQQVQQLAAKERERADESRFASNLVYARSPDQPQQQAQPQASGQAMSSAQRPDSSLVASRTPGEQPEALEAYKRPVEANIDSATGQPYLVYEGIANLETATQSQDASQQTIMATLQRINQALLLQLRTQQDANQINANLALQQIVAQKQQQDAMKSAFRDSSGYESYYNANITTTSSGATNLLTQAY
jgi:type IV secretion system protein VirB10